MFIYRCRCSQRLRTSPHVHSDQLVVYTKSFAGIEGTGQGSQLSPPTGLPVETLIFEMLPEKESCDSASVKMTSTAAASLSARQADSVPETGKGQEILNKKSCTDGMPEHSSSVSSRSVSLQLFSAAGSTSSKSSAPASNRNNESLVDYPAENDGRQNRFRDQDSEDHHRDAVGGSRDSPIVMLDDISSSRHTKRDDQFQMIESAAARLPCGIGDQSLDSDGRRCYSAVPVYSASSPIFETGAVERLYYSAANSVQSNSSSRSLTPAGNSSSGSSARDQVQIAANSYTE